MPERRLQFLPLAPAIVLLVGLLTAGLVALLGVQHLEQVARDGAALRATVLAETVATRLRSGAGSDRTALIERVGARSGAGVLWLSSTGRVLARAGELEPASRYGSFEQLRAIAPSQRLAVGESIAQVSAVGDGTRVVVVAPVDKDPGARASLLGSLGALTLLLVSAAASVAFALARDVQSDVDYLRERIAQMASAATTSDAPVAVRSTDQIGVLTVAFDRLVERFVEAERTHRRDLGRATAYDKDRSAFLAALSHELRTPLNAILGFTDILLSEADGPLSDDAKESLTIVRGSGEHLAALIDDILDLSALESGELRLERKLTDVFDIAEAVVREAAPTAQAKGLELRLEGHHAEAWADPRRLRQIIGNLVGNAVKFTSEGRVSVQVEPVGRNVAITVADTGPGIPRDEQAAIFEEYTQGTEARTRGMGTGLGLSIARRLVRKHGGTILLASELNRGSRFTVVLPRDPDPRLRDDDSTRPPNVAARKGAR